jgi:hypothetical protein
MYWILVVGEHLLQAIKIEAIANVLFVNFAKVLMILQTAEPAYPAVTIFRAI